MSAKRLLGSLLGILGLVFILVGSLVAGANADTATAPEAQSVTAVADSSLGLGWTIALLGVCLSFLGVLMAANAQGAFF